MRERWFSRPRWEFGFAFVLSFVVWGATARLVGDIGPALLPRLSPTVAGCALVLSWPIVFVLTIQLVVLAARVVRLAFYAPKRTGDAILGYVEQKTMQAERRALAIARGAEPGQLSEPSAAPRAGALSAAR